MRCSPRRWLGAWAALVQKLGDAPRPPLKGRSLRGAPDPASDLRHELKFRPLLVLGEQVALHHRGEAALWLQRQVVQWHLRCCLFDAVGDIVRGLEGAIASKRVTYDLARQMPGATEVSTSAFAEAIIEHLP